MTQCKGWPCPITQPHEHVQDDRITQLTQGLEAVKAALGWKEIDRKDYPKNYEKMKYSQGFMEEYVWILHEDRDALRTQIAGLQEQVIARTSERNKLAAERDEARSDLGAKNLLWNSLIAERDRLQAQLATAKDGLEKLKDGPGNKMEGWKATWVHDYARKVLADIQAQGEKAK